MNALWRQKKRGNRRKKKEKMVENTRNKTPLKRITFYKGPEEGIDRIKGLKGEAFRNKWGGEGGGGGKRT